MSIFIPEVPIPTKTVLESHHPWKNRIKAKYANKYKHGHNSVFNPIFPHPKIKLPDKGKCDNNRIQFTIIGNRVTKEFIYCMYLVKGLHKCRQQQFKAPVLRGVTGVEWPKVWNDLKLKYGGIAFSINSQVAVLKDDELLGGDTELKEFVDSRYIYTVYLDYYKEGIQQFANFIQSSGRPCVYMNISVNREPIGSLIFMLYADIAPLTCQNFINMCQLTRGGYSGTPVHRIVQDCWIQCGGFTLKNTAKLECENYIVPHDRRGVLGMANDGRHKDCSTQFFVLLQPASWINNRYVAFGQLIDGENTLSKIENVPTWHESPTSEITIDKAGLLNLDCQRVPINKRTNEYIQGHIEDLVVIGNLFYEALLEKVFEEIEIRLVKQLEEILLNEQTHEEESDENVHNTKRFESKKKEKDQLKKTVGNESEENNEFDVEMYEYDEEFADDIPYSPIPSKEEITTKQFYLPLTDIPYTGEVDSIYDLQKLLRGDYCLEGDLEECLHQSQHELLETKSPEFILDTLFDYLTVDVDMSDTRLDENDAGLLRSYIKENTDSVSFAGRIVKKIANFPQKLTLLEKIMTNKKTDVLNDDELRLIRALHKEMRNRRQRNVSICLPTVKQSHGLVARRQTGFIRPEEIATLLGETLEEETKDEDFIPYSFSSASINSISTELTEKKAVRHQPDLMIADNSKSILSKTSLTEHVEPIRKVTIAKNIYSKRGNNQPGSTLHFGSGSQRIRTLNRLYDGLRISDDDVPPTLKNYKPLTEIYSNKCLLTKSNFKINDDEEQDKYYRNNTSSVDYSIDYVLHLQHGKKVFRKISSDYVRTIGHIEERTQESIRSLEYAKERPTITVAEYQIRNRKYREALMTTHDKATETVSHSFFHTDPGYNNMAPPPTSGLPNVSK